MKSDQQAIEALQKNVQELTDRFQKGFQQVGIVNNALPVIGFEPQQDRNENSPVTIKELAHHQIVKGEGNTPEEALLEWKRELDRLPQQGRTIYWRVLPEVNCDYGFDTRQTRWQIFARLAVLV